MRYEITVLASTGAAGPDGVGPVTLADRCTLTAETLPDAAEAYASLFVGHRIGAYTRRASAAEEEPADRGPVDAAAVMRAMSRAMTDVAGLVHATDAEVEQAGG